MGRFQCGRVPPDHSQWHQDNGASVHGCSCICGTYQLLPVLVTLYKESNPHRSRTDGEGTDTHRLFLQQAKIMSLRSCMHASGLDVPSRTRGCRHDCSCRIPCRHGSRTHSNLPQNQHIWPCHRQLHLKKVSHVHNRKPIWYLYSCRTQEGIRRTGIP